MAMQVRYVQLYNNTLFQGALVGLIISLGITMWLGIGTMLSGPEAPILPASTEGCIIGTLMPNETTTIYTTFTDITTLIMDRSVSLTNAS
jgi:hypothetical protein